jgi:hypothetical protein
MVQRPAEFISSVLSTAGQARPGGTSSTVPKSFAEKSWQRFMTLGGRFVTFASAVVGITCITALVIALSSSRAYGDLDTIGTDSIPSVEAAQAVIPYMEDIDARAADYLANTNTQNASSCIIASTGQQAGNLTPHDCADRIINADLILVNHELFTAGHNATFAGGRTAVEQTQAGLQGYVSAINQMRYEYGLAVNKNDPNDPHMQQAYQAYVSATNILHQHITLTAYNEPDVPSCTINGQVLAAQVWPTGSIEQNMDCLSTISKSHLDAAYDDTVKFVGISLGLVFGLCIYSCIIIVWTTWNMASITHRVINPGLLAALLIALLFTGIVLADFDAMYGLNGDFAVIKYNYQTVYNAASLKRYAAAADADQARWLLALKFKDPHANERYQEWQADTHRVTTLLQTIATGTASAQANQLLVRLHADWQQYNTVSAGINSAQTPSNVTNAETQHIAGAGQAINGFTSTVDRFSLLNYNSYATRFAAAKARLTLLTTWCAVAFLLSGLLGLWGITRKLKEF